MRRRTLMRGAAGAALGSLAAGWQPAAAIATAATADAADGSGAGKSPLPGSFRLAYRLYWGDYPGGTALGRAEVSLDIDAGRYQARLHEQAEGVASLLVPSLTQTSSGRVDASGLLPERYTERRGDKPERALRFDAAGGEIRRDDGGRVGSWRAGVQDRLSVTFQLGVIARLDAGRLAPGHEVVVPVATFSTVHPMRFRSQLDEALRLPGGPVRALHLTRAVVNPEDDERFELWLSLPELMPVRLRVTDPKGRVLDQVRSS